MASKTKKTVILISASSDIGTALCKRWHYRGWNVIGTFRTKSRSVNDMVRMGIPLVSCDLSKASSIETACTTLISLCRKWDILVMCAGAQWPVGSFLTSDFEEWGASIKVNFSNQMRILQRLLLARNTRAYLGPSVLFFSGGGTNNAPLNYSAYIVSKIALVKVCELLDAEVPDTRFTIIGPGWVKTKIHRMTLNAKERAGATYQATMDKFSEDTFTDMERVLDCCDWVVDSPRRIVGGRNFSVVFDKWGTKALAKKLKEEPNMYKLRRYGNDWPRK